LLTFSPKNANNKLMENDREVNHRFVAIRKTKGIKQAEFAKALNISRPTVAGLEKNAKLSERNIKAVCKAYNVNEKWLREGIGEMFNSSPALDESKHTEQAKQLLKYLDQLSPRAQDFLIEYAEKILADEKALRGDEPKKAEKSD